MAEVYAIQHVAVTEIGIREKSLAYQGKKATRKEKECKVLLRQKEDEIKAQEQDRLALKESISCAIIEFPAEEYQEEVDTNGKIVRLSRIAIDLRKHVEELKAK